MSYYYRLPLIWQGKKKTPDFPLGHRAYHDDVAEREGSFAKYGPTVRRPKKKKLATGKPSL
jgi:hypothetical protein